MIKQIHSIWTTPIKLKDRYGMILVLSVIFGIITYRFYQQTHTVPIFLIILFVVFSIILLLWKTPANLIVRVWLSFSRLIGGVVFFTVLTLLYFLIISPIAFVSRIFGKKYFQIKKEGTNWNIVKEKNQYESLG